MSKGETGGDWGEYQLLVLSKLEDLKSVQEESEKRLRSIETELALLKLKSSFWGAVAGLGAYAITMLLQYLQKGGFK